MKNFRLQILLEKTPLTEADKYNICIIFDALSFSRQQQILDNWQSYLEKILAERVALDATYLEDATNALKQANTLLDETIIREQEKETYKEYKKQQIRSELESTVAY